MTDEGSAPGKPEQTDRERKEGAEQIKEEGRTERGIQEQRRRRKANTDAEGRKEEGLNDEVKKDRNEDKNNKERERRRIT